MDLGTFFVEQVIIHRVPKVRIGEKAEFAPRLSEVVSALTPDLKLYFRNRITQSLSAQQFAVVYDPPGSEGDGATEGGPSTVLPRRRPSPIPQLVIDYFRNDGANLVEVSRAMAQYLYDMQGGNNSEGLVVVIDGRAGSGQAAGACLCVLKLQDDPALLITETIRDGRPTMDIELQNVTLPRRAGRVFKAALFPRARALSEVHAIVSDHQRDERAWGSEVAEFFLRYLGCRLRDTPERSTKAYVEALDKWINEIPDDDKRQRYLVSALADISSPGNLIDPRAFASQFLDVDDADSFLTAVTLPDGSVTTFSKDTSLVSEKIKNITAQFAGNIRVTGPRDAMQDSLRREGDHWVIDAALRHIGPSGR